MTPQQLQQTQQQYITYVQEEPPKMKVRARTQDPEHHVSVAKDAMEKMSLMHQEMAEVEATLNDLTKTNQWLKRKLITDRQDLLEKYFMADNHLLKQANLREWRHLVEVEKR